MTGEILNTIAKELDGFLQSKTSHPEGKDLVYISSPTDNEGKRFPKGDGLYMSLINIEEELIFREGRKTHRVSGNTTVTTQPPVNINLQVIFIANYPNDYKTELNMIYHVMSFFQAKPLFTVGNTPNLAQSGLEENGKLLFELNTVPLRELHYIWGNLGVNQMPSVTYLLKMLTIQESKVKSAGGVIEKIEMIKKG